MTENAIPEVMPTVTTSSSRGRTLWVSNLIGDRHHDLLFLTPEDGDTLSLSEAQARDLHAKLGDHIAAWDAKGSTTPRS